MIDTAALQMQTSTFKKKRLLPMQKRLDVVNRENLHISVRIYDDRSPSNITLFE